MALFDFAVRDAVKRFVLGVEADGRTFVVAANGFVDRADFDDRAARSKVTEQYGKSAAFGCAGCPACE